MREALEPEPASDARLGPIREQDEHGQRRDCAGEDLEQVARERVDPVAVLEHEDERLFGRSRTQAVGEERLERRLAQLGVEGARQLVVRDRDAEESVEQGSTLDERRVDALELAFERAHLLRLRQLVVDAQEPAPDLAPDPVARRAVGLALAEGDEVPASPGPSNELCDQPRLSHPGLGGDPDHATTAFARAGEALLQGLELRRASDDR